MNNFDDIFDNPTQPESAAPEQEQPQKKLEWWQVKEQKQRKEAYDTLDNIFNAFSEGKGDVQGYLDTHGRFDRYSARNALLIHSKCPEATQIGDFKYWEKQGAEILKTEKRNPIVILEPGKADGNRGKSNESKLKQAKKRYDEVTRLFDRLYEDSLSGRISNDNFTRLIDKYQTEQEQLLGQIQSLENALQEVKDSQTNAVQWAALMAEYVGIQELTAENLNLLVECIEVFDRTQTEAGTEQAIKICYRFGGYIEERRFKAKVLRNTGGWEMCRRKEGKDNGKVSFVS